MSCFGGSPLRQLPSRPPSSAFDNLEQLSSMIFDHLVQFDEATREIVIYRVEPNGQRSLYTKTELPNTKGWSKAVDHFAKQLGENLLMDSEVARKLLQL